VVVGFMAISQRFYKEALIWEGLHHPFILPFLGIDTDTFPSSLCMVSPWMENGTVLVYLKDHGLGEVDRLVSRLDPNAAGTNNLLAVHHVSF
jgi:serine/threonine protein kinase